MQLLNVPLLLVAAIFLSFYYWGMNLSLLWMNKELYWQNFVDFFSFCVGSWRYCLGRDCLHLENCVCNVSLGRREGDLRRNNRLLRNKVRRLEQQITRLEEREQEGPDSDTPDGSEPDENQALGEVAGSGGEGPARLKAPLQQGLELRPSILNTLRTWLEQLGLVNKWNDEKMQRFVEAHTNQVKEILRRRHQEEMAEQQQIFNEQLALEREDATNRLQAAQETIQELRGLPNPTMGSPTTPGGTQMRNLTTKRVRFVDESRQFPPREHPSQEELERLFADEKDHGCVPSYVRELWNAEELQRRFRNHGSVAEVEADIRNSVQRQNDAEIQLDNIPINDDSQDLRGSDQHEIIRREESTQRRLGRIIDYMESINAEQGNENEETEIIQDDEEYEDSGREEESNESDAENGNGNGNGSSESYESESSSDSNESLTAENEEEISRLIDCQYRISATVLEIARSQGKTLPGEPELLDCEPIIHMLGVYHNLHNEFEYLRQSVLNALQLLGEEPPSPPLPTDELVSAYIVESVDLIRTAEEQARNTIGGQGSNILIDELRGRARAYERTIINLQAEIISLEAQQSATEPTARAWTASSTARRVELYNEMRREIREYTETLQQMNPDYRPPPPELNSWYFQHEDPRDFDNDQEFVECFTIGEIQRFQNHLDKLRQQVQTNPDVDRLLSTRWAAVNTRVNAEIRDALAKRNTPRTSHSMQPPLPPKHPLSRTSPQKRETVFGMRPVPDSTQFPVDAGFPTAPQNSSQPSATPFDQIDPSSSPQTFNDQFTRKYGPFVESPGGGMAANAATTQESLAGGNQSDDLTSEPVILSSDPNDYDDDEL